MVPVRPPKVSVVTVVLRPTAVVPATLLVVSSALFCSARLLARVRVPALTTVAPVKVFALPSTVVAAPCLVSEKLPPFSEITALTVPVLVEALPPIEPLAFKTTEELLSMTPTSVRRAPRFSVFPMP